MALRPPIPFKIPKAGPFLIGMVVAPLAGTIVKPLLRGTVKAAVSVGLQVKKLVAEAAEEFQDIAAEASADQAAADAGAPADAATVSAPRKAATPVVAPKKP
jgi:hypothetical protein